jgi:hypothetical protein
VDLESSRTQNDALSTSVRQITALEQQLNEQAQAHRAERDEQMEKVASLEQTKKDLKDEID